VLGADLLRRVSACLAGAFHAEHPVALERLLEHGVECHRVSTVTQRGQLGGRHAQQLLSLAVERAHPRATGLVLQQQRQKVAKQRCVRALLTLDRRFAHGQTQSQRQSAQWAEWHATGMRCHFGVRVRLTLSQ